MNTHNLLRFHRETEAISGYPAYLEAGDLENYFMNKI